MKCLCTWAFITPASRKRVAIAVLQNRSAELVTSSCLLSLLILVQPPRHSPRTEGRCGGYSAGLCSAFNYRYKMGTSKKKKKKTPWGFRTPVHTNKTPPHIEVQNEAKQRSCNTLMNVTLYISTSAYSKPLTLEQVQDKPLIFSSSPKTVSTLDARWGTID